MEQENASTASPPPPAGPNPDHQTAMWAHIGGGIVALTCFLGWLAWAPPLIVYLTQKDKSSFVAFHSFQALCLFGVTALATFILWAVGLVGLFFFTLPLAFLMNVGAFVYALMIGLKAKDGNWAEYAVIGEFAKGQHPKDED